MSPHHEVIWDKNTAEVIIDGKLYGWFRIQPSFEVHEHDLFWRPRPVALLRLRGLSKDILPVVAFAKDKSVSLDKWAVEEDDPHFPASLGGPVIADLVARRDLHRRVLLEVQRRGFMDTSPTFRSRKLMAPDAVATWFATADR